MIKKTISSNGNATYELQLNAWQAMVVLSILTLLSSKTDQQLLTLIFGISAVFFITCFAFGI